MRAPIHSRKHYVQLSQATVAQGVNLNTSIVTAIEGAPTLPNHVSEGAIVKAIYAEVWAGQDSASVVGSFVAGMVKLPGGVNNVAFADTSALHDYNNKKNILYTTQGLSPPNDSGLMLLHKGWIAVPKGKQRFGLGDGMQWFNSNHGLSAVDMNVCGLFIFKEYQ